MKTITLFKKAAFMAMGVFGVFSFTNAQVLVNGINYDTVTIAGTKVAQVVALPKVPGTDNDGNSIMVDVRYTQESITIPASVNLYGTDYAVKKIGDNSLRNNNNLTSLTLPNGLAVIGNSSLAQCENLPSVLVPSSCTSIEDWAFYGCKKLGSINFPEGITAITEHTFQQCSSLTSVTLPSTCTSLKVCAFQDASNLASINLENIREVISWSLYGTKIPSVTLTDVTQIGDCAFAKNTELTTVVLNNVGEIRPWNFQDCTNLTSVTLNGTELIQGGVFSGCSSLTSLRIPNTVNFIDEWSLEKTGITKIYASWADPENNVVIAAKAFGENAGKISFEWYVPSSVYMAWDDFFMGYRVMEDLEGAVNNNAIDNNQVYYNAGVLNLKNMAGEKATVFSVDGRAVANFMVTNNDFNTTLSLANGIYILRTSNGNIKFAAK